MRKFLYGRNLIYGAEIQVSELTDLNCIKGIRCLKSTNSGI